MNAPKVVVVLGCRTNADGTASEMMRYRIEQAAKVYHSLAGSENASHPWVIVSGYQAPGDQIITEAKAMLNYIQEQKLMPTEHIILEEQAPDTSGNAYWSRIIVDNLGASEVHIITTQFHLKRTQKIFEMIYSPQIYKLHFHDSQQTLDEETLKWRKEREEKLSNNDFIEDQLTDITQNIKVSPDGKSITLLYSPIITDQTFKHGYTTRFGGISTYKTLSSLNLMFNPKRHDPKINVTENRQRLALQCGYNMKQFHMAKCVHGNKVWVIGDQEPESYDALVSNKPGITIAAPGADCSILLFCDPIKRVCAAAHSGWRGTLAKISHSVLCVMRERYDCDVKNINVAIGPTIGPCCFEVGEDVAQQFAAISSDVVIRKDNKPKPFVDIRKTTRILLEEYGVLPQNIDDLSREFKGVKPEQRVTQCTFCDGQKRFFSYRRDGSQYGTQIGWISVRRKENEQK